MPRKPAPPVPPMDEHTKKVIINLINHERGHLEQRATRDAAEHRMNLRTLDQRLEGNKEQTNQLRSEFYASRQDICNRLRRLESEVKHHAEGLPYIEPATGKTVWAPRLPWEPTDKTMDLTLRLAHANTEIDRLKKDMRTLANAFDEACPSGYDQFCKQFG